MSATMWTSAVDSYLDGSVLSAEITDGFEDGSIKLLKFMEYLGPALTNKDNGTRGRAVKLVADVLHSLKSVNFSPQEVDVLCSFLCEKLCDHHSIQPPALYGLAAIVNLNPFPDGCAEQICRKIFKEVQNQTLSQADRRNVYLIMNVLLCNKLKDLQSMGGDFVLGYIQTMDGEKDPRNLILAFQIAKTVIDNFSLGVFVEEMFEVVSCYFPISFSPPPDNPHGITKEDLVLSLRACLSATPRFGEHCLPLLLEKMTSDIISAKIDSYETLAECAEVYGTNSLQEFITSFYSCIRKEIVDDNNEDVKKSALRALSAIIKTLSTDVSDENSPSVLKTYIGEILSEYRVYILKSDVKILYNSSSLLHCICSTSPMSCCIVLKTVIPLLLLQYTNQTQINCRRCLIDILNTFISQSAKHNTQSVLSIIQSSKAELITTYTDLLCSRDKDMCCHGSQGMTAILNCNSVISTTEVEGFGNNLVKVALNTKEAKVRKDVLSTLQLLSKMFPCVVQVQVFPEIIQTLHQDKMEIDGGVVLSKEEIFSILSAIANHVLIFKDVCDVIFENMNQEKDRLCSSTTLTSCLLDIVNDNKSDEDILEYINTTILPKLLLYIQNKYTQLTTIDVNNIAAVFRISTTSSDQSTAVSVCQNVVKLFLPQSDNLKEIKFKPLQISASCEQKKLLPIFTAVVCSLPKSVPLPTEEDIISSVIKLSTTGENTAATENSIKCLSGLLNKLNEAKVDEILHRLKPYLVPDNSQNSTELTETSVLLLVWLTKALVLRNHSTGKLFIEQLIELLKTPLIGSMITDKFSIITTEHDDILNRSMKADIKMFYHQRLFLKNNQKLVDGYHETDNGALKKNYLIVLCDLIKPLPRNVFLTELPPLLPLLISSLVYEDKNLISVTLETIQTLCKEKDGYLTICKKLDSLIPQLLKLCKCLHGMNIRMAALKCLATISTVPTHYILPYRNTVTHSLHPVLDDRKRLVRKEAVVARSLWYLIAEPGT